MSLPRRRGFSRAGEPGSNGLTVDAQGRLTLCEHGDRRVARLEKNGRKTTLADRYQGKRFNSPNDLVYKSNGDLYFTDPPYGLEGREKDPKKEIPFQGVYRLKPNGELTLLTDELKFPNGLAFSPDEKTLYVAVSDPEPDLRGDYIRLRIADSGVGMDWETQSRMFEPFYTTKPQDQGIGLGLSVTHGIVRNCGGSISVDSALGRGTTLNVYFPKPA